MSGYLKHRCPYCKSDNIIHLKKPEKSILQKGLEIAGGFAEGFYLGTDGTITETISNAFYDPSKHPQFQCGSCKRTWNKANMVDETPIEVLEAEKKLKISSLTKRFLRNVVWTVIVGAITVWSFMYCWDNDLTTTRETEMWLIGKTEVTDYHYEWLGVGFIFLCSLGLTIYKLFTAIEIYENISKLRRMSAESFRHSLLRS